jgi:hypothetical protein
MRMIHLDAFYSYYEQLTIKQPACYAMGNSRRLLKGLSQEAAIPLGGELQRAAKQRTGQTCGYVQTSITPFRALFFVASSEKYATKKRSSGMERLVGPTCEGEQAYSSYRVEYTCSRLSRQLSKSK